MDRILQTIIDAVLGLHGTAAYIVVGSLAFGEAAAFAGLITPGEVAMVLGGVLVSQGRAGLGAMCLVAGVGAVLGDTAGYWLGRRFGTRLLRWDPVANRFGDRIDRASTYIRKRGGRAVVLGRWASVVRTFVPFTVGMTGMPYGRFVLFSIPAAASWAVAFVVLGYAAGASWHLVERYAGRASIVLLLVIVIAVALRWLAKRARANEEALQVFASRVAELRGIRWLRSRYGNQLRWVAHRFDPRIARGLGLTLGFVVLVTGGILAGVILNDVRGFRGIARLDWPVRLWFFDARTDALTEVARVVEAAFRMPWMLVPTAVVAAFGGWHAIPRVAVRIVVGGIGSAGIAFVIQDLVTEQVAGSQFPPTSVVVVATLVVHIVAVLATRLEWAVAVTAAAVGAFAVALVGIASLVTGTGVLSGVAFGAAMGVAWAAAVEVQARLPFRFFADDPVTSPRWMPEDLRR